jgi:glycosyltransferase involved in cell wall biosynthesis
MMAEFKPLLSVIVPVYNVEEQLSRCVESILKQTYTNFELLLVNDGSKDSSGEICDFYAQKDSRVKVFHKENGGASSARNIGIENAAGEYICFVDSDDYVDENYLSSFFVDALTEDKYTLVIQSLINEIDGHVVKKTTFYEGLYNENEFSKLFCLNNLVSKGYTVCKLYNIQIIKNNNLRFNPHIHYNEDLLFMLTYLSYVKNVYLSNKMHYHYVSTDGSLSKKYNSYESEILTYNLLNNAFKILVEIFKLNKDAKDSFNNDKLGSMLFRSILTIYRPENKKPKKERISILKDLCTTENLVCLQKYTQKNLKIHRFGYFIYKSKLYSLFDLYYSSVFNLRYCFDKQWKYYLRSKQLKPNKK